jgi:hypothetical protein
VKREARERKREKRTEKGNEPSVEGDFGFESVLFQLIVRTGTECIGTDQSRFPSALLQVISVLGDGSGFARALQTDKHDDVGLAFLQLIGFDSRIQQLVQTLNDGLKNKKKSRQRERRGNER